MNEKKIGKRKRDNTHIFLILLFLFGAMISSSKASSLTSTSTYTNPDGLIMYHDFSACTGTSATDRGDWGNTGTLTGGTTNLTWVTGKYGCGLSFAGIYAYVALPNVAILNFTTGSFTLSAWIKPTSVSGTFAIFGKSNTANYYPSVDFLQSNDKLRFFIYNGSASGIDASSASVLTANTWQYVSIVWNTSHMCFYYNGILTDACQSATLPVIPDNIYPMYIGNQGQLNVEFIGKIDEPKIWNNAKTAEEVYVDYLGTYQAIEKYYQSLTTNNITAVGANLTAFNQSTNNTLNSLANNMSIFNSSTNGTLNALASNISSLANITASDVWNNDINRTANCTNCEVAITVNNTNTTNNYNSTEIINNSYPVNIIVNDTNTTNNFNNSVYLQTHLDNITLKRIAREVAFYLPDYQAQYDALNNFNHPILLGYALPFPYITLFILAVFFIICAIAGVSFGLWLNKKMGLERRFK